MRPYNSIREESARVSVGAFPKASSISVGPPTPTSLTIMAGVASYNSTTLSPVGVFNDCTPGGGQAGIWMAGAGPAFDAAGNVYYATGNGSFDGVTDFGESPPSSFRRALMNELDYFAPADFGALNADDLDFGSAGPTLLPGTSLIIQGGKEGRLLSIGIPTVIGTGDCWGCSTPAGVQARGILLIRPNATHHIHNASPVWNAPSGQLQRVCVGRERFYSRV